MDKKLLIKEILRDYDIKRGIAEEKKAEEIKKAYQMCPELEKVDTEINMLGLSNMRKILKNGINSAELKAEFERELGVLTKKREALIVNYGINPEYDQPAYQCKKCRDTGYNADGSKCECFEKILTAKYYEKSQLGKMIDNADFSNFRLDYYSPDIIDGYQTGREVVGEALKYAKYFCEHFDDNISNIFFYGSTGLGKTYLSSIIAREVMNKGKSVDYVRATRIFSLYDEYKFKNYSLKPEIDELYTCDLLVIDDLGSEFIAKNGISFFFDLMNDRIINNKKIIINTNLDIASFSSVYTVRLTSRIYESFKIFRFEGEDIRIQKLIERSKK